MSGAILFVFGLINSMLLGIGGYNSTLLKPVSSQIPNIYNFSMNVMKFVMMPIAYSVLALFFVLELHKVTLKVEGAGGGSMFGTEVVFRVIVKMAICKIIIDSVPVIMQAIYELSIFITKKISELQIANGGTAGGFNLEPGSPLVEEIKKLDIFGGLPILIIGIIVLLVTGVAFLMVNILIIVRIVEIYILMAVAPIPLATFPNEEASHVGKSFLKSFTAVCIQGVILFLVIAFFPLVIVSPMMNIDTGTTGAFSSLLKAGGLSIVLGIMLGNTRSISKSIIGAM